VGDTAVPTYTLRLEQHNSWKLVESARKRSPLLATFLEQFTSPNFADHSKKAPVVISSKGLFGGSGDNGAKANESHRMIGSVGRQSASKILDVPGGSSAMQVPPRPFRP
jgi:hypothetical protein